MCNQPHYHQAPSLPFLWRGIAAASLLWLLAIFSLEVNAYKTANEFDRHGIVASVDMPLHANSEHSFSLKRYFSRHKDQPSSVELPEPFWVLLASDPLAPLLLVATNQHSSAAPSLPICAHQWQTLNVPRAPPLV
jgi:hypothetical protein